MSTMYIARPSKLEFNILSFISIYDVIFTKDYKVKGEAHNFWELVVIKKGIVGITADNQIFKLKEGQAIFHQPGEFHNIWSTQNTTPHVFIITFTLDSPFEILQKTICTLSDFELQLISYLIQESHFLITKTNHSNNSMELQCIQQPPYAMDQTLKNLLEIFIIQVIRNNNLDNKKFFDIPTINPHYSKVISYINANLFNKLTMYMICESCNISESTLKKLFKKYVGISVIEYVNSLKISEAKRLLERGISQKEISNKLAFSSPYYFSTVFKRVTGYTPSYYKQHHLSKRTSC